MCSLSSAMHIPPCDISGIGHSKPVTHDYAASCGLTVVHFIYQKYQGWPQEPTSSQLEPNMAIYHSIVQPQSLNTIILLILVSYATSPDPSGCHN